MTNTETSTSRDDLVRAVFMLCLNTTAAIMLSTVAAESRIGFGLFVVNLLCVALGLFRVVSLLRWRRLVKEGYVEEGKADAPR